MADIIERNSIYAIQRFLRSLHLVDPAIPLVNPDGVYGDETREAVRIFQRQNGLPDTGEVDFATWERLSAAAAAAGLLLAAPDSLAVFRAGQLPLAPGVYAGEVYILQALLNALSLRYANIRRVDMTGRYDAQTIAQVENVQRLLGEQPDGVLTHTLWNRMAALYRT